jgi:cytochrome c-type biogenesis protein
MTGEGDDYVTKVNYWLLPIAVSILALLGYVGYLLYPRFGLPAVEGVSMLLLSATAGMASFFSPCSFPLLVTLLARHTRTEEGDTKSASIIRNTFSFAIALSLGTALFLLLSGLIISIAGEALFAGIVFDSPAGRIIRGIVGILLITFGLMQLGILPISFHMVEKISIPMLRSGDRLRSTNPFLGFVLFGFGYLLAGFG